MSNRLILRNPDNVVKVKHGGLVAATVTLSTAAASTTGNRYNQLAIVAGKKFEGVAMYCPMSHTLDSGDTLTVTGHIRHCTASAGTYVTLATGTVTLAGTTDTGLTVAGILKVDASLVPANKWITTRVITQGSASDTGYDQSATAITLAFFGPDHGPAATST